MTAAPDNGRAFALWRAGAGADWRACMRHAVVEPRGAEAATPYPARIDTHAGDGCQEVCRRVGRRVDAAAERRLGADFGQRPRWPRVAARFRTATRLEGGFWGMGLRPA